jgi:hypothetical protein
MRLLLCVMLFCIGNFCVNQAKRKERMVKEKLQKQMMSVAEQQQRLNKVRMELDKLETVRLAITGCVFHVFKVSFLSAYPSGC